MAQPKIPPPPTDTVTVAVELDSKDLHFVDSVIKGYDNLAQVRRDYRLHRGRPCYEILVSPDRLEELRAVLERLRAHVWIGLVEVLPSETETESGPGPEAS